MERFLWFLLLIFTRTIGMAEFVKNTQEPLATALTVGLSVQLYAISHQIAIDAIDRMKDQRYALPHKSIKESILEGLTKWRWSAYSAFLITVAAHAPMENYKKFDALRIGKLIGVGIGTTALSSMLSGTATNFTMKRLCEKYNLHRRYIGNATIIAASIPPILSGLITPAALSAYVFAQRGT